MSSEIDATQAAQRLFAISWEFDDSRIQDYVDLMQEYLRRSVMWAKALDALDYWPWLDVASRVLPTVHAPEPLVRQLHEHFERTTLRLVVKWTCQWYLRWATIRESPEVRAFNLPEPYEPLISMYELGGDFSTEHGFIDIGPAGIVAMDWHEYDSS